MKPAAYLEVATLFDRNWTGIPTVTAGIANQAIRDDGIDWTFCFGGVSLPRDFVASMLEQRTGEGRYAFLAQHVWKQEYISYDRGARAKALFPHIKTVRGLFAAEAMFVHDLTPLLTPQYFTQDAIDHFSDRIAGDVASSSRFFCNSKATRDDLVAYLDVDPGQTSVIRMGVDIDLFDLAAAQDLARSATIEPYVVVLGTLEPRKNGKIVLDYLLRDPGFASRYRLVFVGREGWLDERVKIMAAIAEAGVPADRVVFTGFVSEAEKVSLLLNCQFCIYASMFEGYGLPIGEAAALGKLIVCSDTSSMPEVAPEMCLFFDPTDLADFSRAMGRGEKRSSFMRTSRSLSEVADRLQLLGWEDCYRDIAAWVHD